MKTYQTEDFKKQIEYGAYAFPGGYPVFFITYDGEALSFDSAKANQSLITEAIETADNSGGWRVIGCEINWEDATLTCAHSNKRIESAYGETEDKV